jgi:hypothetical protein
MTWTHDPTDNAYTLIAGEIRCRVWLTTLGTWAAVIMHHGISTAAYNFTTPDDAKIWCEMQARGSARGQRPPYSQTRNTLTRPPRRP